MMWRYTKFMLVALTMILALAGLNVQAAYADGPYEALGCGQVPRLTVGGQGRVTLYPDQPNTIRATAGFNAATLGYIPVGHTFTVLGGPQCVSGTLFWLVEYAGVTGWTGEGNGWGTYWLEPVSVSPVCALPNRLSVGGQGRVTPGLPNVVRTAPGTTATGSHSVVIGEIPAGGVFSVLSGPACGSDNRWWWYVNYNGLVGWTAEGEGSWTYWTEPVSPPTCAATLPSRLWAGGQGRVTWWPNLPNRLRSAPGYGASVIGHIPAGGEFYIHSGPTCADNTAWWQVSANGVTGWTAEGGNGYYYLEPR